MSAEAKIPLRPRVLIVDDDDDLRTLTQIQLSDSFEVVQAATGRECVELAVIHSPDVILLDLMMPEMDGSEVLSHLTAHPVTKDIPVIFLSAIADTKQKVETLEAGAVDYIAKPVDRREFIARVGAAARTRARHEEIRRDQDDAATGLGGRKAFDARLLQEVARAKRKNVPLAILLFDVDGMRQFGAGAGRDVADGLIGRIAQILQSTLRTSDSLFRYGENECAAILPETEAGTAFLAAERCRAATQRGELGVTLSIGLAELTMGHTPYDLITKAELALFKAKDSGGDRTWRSDDPRRRSLNPMSLAEELTEREWAILANLAERRTEQDIARRMGIRPGTVRSHKARIRRKLHVPRDSRLTDFVRDNYSDLIGTIALGEVEEAVT